MKMIYLLLSLISYLNTRSQTYILIERQLTWDSYLADTITQKASAEYLPIYKQELDSLIKKVEPLWDITKLGMNKTYLDENDYSFSHLKFKIQSVAGTYGDKYDILLISEIGTKKFTFRLSNPEEDAATNRRTVQKFIKTLKKIQTAISKGQLKLKRA